MAGSLVAGAEYDVVAVDGEPVVPGSAPTLAFDLEGRVSGRATLNRLMGRYELSGDVLRLGALATTMMAGPEDLMAQEQRVLAVLGGGDLAVTTEVGALFSHDYYESFDFTSPGYWLDVGRISVTQQIRRDLVFVAQATIGSRDFVSSSRTEDFYDFDAGLKWGIMPGLVLSLNDTYEIQHANQGNGSFNSNVTLLHLTKSF